ncbi:hypothetical protein Tco_1080408 [Tanacetum coccineum]|uniref:Uncharacterized protein n=1 Tax=Tanacetum coccineum TaxID=301880 RepID=A0ABQ5HUM0_9ASTR
MEMKDTLSSCSDSEGQQMQLVQDKAKKSCMVSFRQLQSHLKLLSNNDLKGTRTECGFKRAFATVFGQDVETFTSTMFLYVDQLETQLDKEEFQEIGSMASFKVLETQFKMFIKSRMYLDDEFVDISSRSGNDAHADDADIRPVYDEEPMTEVDQNAEQCHDTCPLLVTLTDNQTTELSNQSLEFENIRLKKTVAQFQKDFLRMEAHCVNLELKYQNQALKEEQHGQFLKVKSNEAKVKHDIDAIETINIELEHKVAKLLKENETLKRHYKELYDSIKKTRVKNIEHTTSLIANNDKFKAQLQEKGFAIAALKNELRSYALSWKPCQGDSLNLPDHRIHKDGDGDASFQLKSDSLPHAHAQTTKTYYKHQDSRIMKAQELKTKTSAQTLIYKIFLQRYQVYQGRLLASFQDDAKYEHVGQDTRSQGGKDDQDGRIKI